MVTQQKSKCLRFGDIVINHWASDANPHKRGVVVKVKRSSIEFTDMDGYFWSIVNDKESKFELVGSVLKDKKNRY